MKYITTNIRLPQDLWKLLKLEAMNQRKRFSEVVRARLLASLHRSQSQGEKKIKSLRGLLKGAKISDALIEEAKQSLFFKKDL